MQCSSIKLNNPELNLVEQNFPVTALARRIMTIRVEQAALTIRARLKWNYNYVRCFETPVFQKTFCLAIRSAHKTNLKNNPANAKRIAWPEIMCSPKWNLALWQSNQMLVFNSAWLLGCAVVQNKIYICAYILWPARDRAGLLKFSLC
jgi:uncharacterized membrane protein YeiB